MITLTLLSPPRFEVIGFQIRVNMLNVMHIQFETRLKILQLHTELNQVMCNELKILRSD